MKPPKHKTRRHIMAKKIAGAANLTAAVQRALHGDDAGRCAFTFRALAKHRNVQAVEVKRQPRG